VRRQRGRSRPADVGAAADSPTVTHSICDRYHRKAERELQADGAVSASAGIFGKIHLAERGGAELPTHRHRRGGMQRQAIIGSVICEISQ
jgi:hypothetical protein